MSSAAKQLQKSRINDVLYAIHRDLARPWTAEPLAAMAAYSTHHFHRIFKSVTGENLNVYIRRTRLERAANLLIFHRDLAVGEAAHRCGFTSLSSFTHCFKAHFGETPSQWRDGGYLNFSSQIADQHGDKALGDKLINAGDQDLPPVSVLECNPVRVAYIRHQGYDRSIAYVWQQLREWAMEQGVQWDSERMIGLYHSNPRIVPLADCHYVACISVPERVCRYRDVAIMTIPGGLHAQVHVTGHYGDLLPALHQLLSQWLPRSPYKMALTPAFACYQVNQFLSEDERFEVKLCLPVVTR